MHRLPLRPGRKPMIPFRIVSWAGSDGTSGLSSWACWAMSARSAGRGFGSLGVRCGVKYTESCGDERVKSGKARSRVALGKAHDDQVGRAGCWFQGSKVDRTQDCLCEVARSSTVVGMSKLFARSIELRTLEYFCKRSRKPSIPAHLSSYPTKRQRWGPVGVR
jgi:hypothetical protein